ncbi:MAG: hypothetical protein ACI9DC_000158 [Gammaproteobacteria bacterium]|jgi:hypothetical protein
MRTIGNKHLLATCVLASLLATATGIAFAQQSLVVRISAGSNDGDSTSYVVRCANKTKASVYTQGERSEYCAIARGGKLRCDPKWTLDDASEYACKVGPNR